MVDQRESQSLALGGHRLGITDHDNRPGIVRAGCRRFRARSLAVDGSSGNDFGCVSRVRAVSCCTRFGSPVSLPADRTARRLVRTMNVDKRGRDRPSGSF